MARDKTEAHEKIIKAAMDEFAGYGFENASMRRIASEAGLTVGALYRHFPNKEEMFAALVMPTIEELKQQYVEYSSKGYEAMKLGDVHKIMDECESETEWIMSFIYDHLDVFRLLICRSQGTRFESFIHDMAKFEERSTLDFFERMKQQGISVRDISPREFHVLVTANVSALFETVVHDFSREEAMHYAKTLEEFFTAGWIKILGI